MGITERDIRAAKAAYDAGQHARHGSPSSAEIRAERERRDLLDSAAPTESEG